MRPARWIGIALAIMLAIARPALAGEEHPPLVIFHADSLTAYVEALAREFSRSHPGVEVRHEGSGSLDAIRKVTDLHRSCDILMTADWRLLDNPRIGTAPWMVIFATNSIGLLYTERAAGAAEITTDNWHKILARPGVRYSHSDPARDPAGYWTLIAWQLAERYYRNPGMARRLADQCPAANIRPHNIELISLLESGELDYYFGYPSDARLARLKFVALPAEINLGDPAHAAEYATASVEVGAGNSRRKIEGGLIGYGAALTRSGADRSEAADFLKLMLGAEGRALAAQFGFTPYRRVIGSNSPPWLP